MNKEEIRQALVKFDREDLLFGNNDIYLDDNVEVFLTISQMIKFNNQQKKIDQLTNNWNKLEELIDEEKTRLAKECSHTYEDSLGKTKYVNEDIFNELNNILDKMKEIKENK